MSTTTSAGLKAMLELSLRLCSQVNTCRIVGRVIEGTLRSFVVLVECNNQNLHISDVIK
jgi:hypothetical protein